MSPKKLSNIFIQEALHQQINELELKPLRVDVQTAYGGLTVNLNRKWSQEEAEEVFHAVAELAHEARDIKVEQEESPAIDFGGPAREFLSSLFQDLITSDDTGKYFQKNFSMAVPCFHQEEIPAKEVTFFEHLGRLMALVANSGKSVGELMERETLNVISEMAQDDYFGGDLDSYDFTDQAVLDRFGIN